MCAYQTQQCLPITHRPVLLEEVIGFLAIHPRPIFLDGTFGGGGHSRSLLEAYPTATIIALDQDPTVQAAAQDLQSTFTGRFTFYPLNFKDLNQIPGGPFGGILLDLGVSSFQLDNAERGFSFRKEAFLDMRMNPNQGRTAASFLEEASKEELIKAIREYGEEPQWKRIVAAILEARGSGKLQSTLSFAQLLERATRSPAGGKPGIHPATRAFQGIRIAVNDELNALEQALPLAFEQLAPGGRLVVISFHSLEDRIVKRFFRRMAGLPEHKADNKPQQFREAMASIATPKPVAPSALEINTNPRSRSAKLRVLIKH